MFVFSHSQEGDGGDGYTRYLHVERLSPAPRKVLLKHKVTELYVDTGFKGLELGKCVVGDTTLSFFSAWTFDRLNAGHPWAARKQVYRVTKTGTLVRMEARIAFKKGGHHCGGGPDGFASQQEGETKAAYLKRGAEMYEACMDERYQARAVHGKEAENLLNEIRYVLRKELDAAYHEKYSSYLKL